jgi:hypothetical protein
MSEFNFDELLDEIEESEKTEMTTATGTTEALDDLLDDLTDGIEEQAEPDESTEQTEIDLDSLLDEPDEPDELNEPQMTSDDNNIVDIGNHNQTNQSQSGSTSISEEPTYESTGVEFAEEYPKYWKGKQEFDMRKKALKDEEAEFKKEMEEAGVDISFANRAYKEVTRELKESAEQAQRIESLKKMIKADDIILGTINDLLG